MVYLLRHKYIPLLNDYSFSIELEVKDVKSQDGKCEYNSKSRS